MFSFERYSQHLATRIGYILGHDSNKQEIVSYGINVLFYNVVGIIVVLVIAYLVDVLPSCVALIVTLFLLRPAAGGAHCTNSLNCSVFGYLFIPLLGLVSVWLARAAISVQLIVTVSAFLLTLGGIIKYAPYIAIEKPRAMAQRRRLKARALILAVLIFTVALGFIFFELSAWGLGLAAGLLFQGLMLLPPGVHFVRGFDFLINNLARKLGGEQR